MATENPYLLEPFTLRQNQAVNVHELTAYVHTAIVYMAIASSIAGIRLLNTRRDKGALKEVI